MIRAHQRIIVTVTDPLEAREAIRQAPKLGYQYVEAKAEGLFEDQDGESVHLSNHPVKSFGKVRAVVDGIACEGRKKGSTVFRALNLKPSFGQYTHEIGRFHLRFSPSNTTQRKDHT